MPVEAPDKVLQQNVSAFRNALEFELGLIILLSRSCRLLPVVLHRSFGLSMLAFLLVFEAFYIVYHIQTENKLRRLRYSVGRASLGGGGFVELPPVSAKEEFAHLPGLEPSPCFHLFLSHAWPLGQD
eukprot:5114586-Prymnesium_polylepis.1